LLNRRLFHFPARRVGFGSAKREAREHSQGTHHNCNFFHHSSLVDFPLWRYRIRSSPYYQQRNRVERRMCRPPEPKSRSSGTVVAKKKVDFTGNIQLAGDEKQPGVEHLRCKARRPLVAPPTSIWRPEITVLQMGQYSWSSREFHARLLSSRRKAASLPSVHGRIGCSGENMLPMMAIPSGFARTEQARDRGRERELPPFLFHPH
jgi:hypothetical protein